MEHTEFDTKHELEEKRKVINTFEELESFLKEVKEKYNCGYGDAPRAIAQACLAVGKYLSKEFGLTGFQAGYVMWDFILGWSKTGNKTGLKLIDYDYMLYPQYEDDFEKELPADVWKQIQKTANELIEESDNGANVAPRVYQHWQSIANGKIPFGYIIEK